MRGDIHENYVLYRTDAQPGHRYRQIVVVDMGQFVVFAFEGDVIRPDPTFEATSDLSGAHFHPTLQDALEDAGAELRESVNAGWIRHKA